MKASDFLKNEIDNLVRKVPYIKCSYEYVGNSLLHLIHVQPLQIYKSNEKYIDAETDVIFSFIESFPLENVSFISDDSLITIKNPEYIKEGDLYNIIGLYQNLNQNVQQISPNRKFPTFADMTNRHVNFWSEEKSLIEPIREVSYAGNTSYAMAA